MPIPSVSVEDIRRLEKRIEHLEAVVAKLTSTEVATTEKAPAKRKRGIRLPEGFFPEDETVAQIRAEFPHISSDHLTLEHRKFCDYWYGKATNATKLDWEATWRNWMRTAFEKVPQTALPNGRSLSTVDQKIMDMQARKGRL